MAQKRVPRGVNTAPRPGSIFGENYESPFSKYDGVIGLLFVVQR